MIGMETKRHSLCRVQGAPEVSAGENQTGQENEMVQEHCCEPISSSRNHKAWRSELSHSFMDVVKRRRPSATFLWKSSSRPSS